jgi:cytochrome oxidase assembly protein ShyY1
MTQKAVVPLSQKPQSNKKLIVGFVLLIVVGLICISLGRWQLKRADERRAIAQSIEAGRARPPIQLNAATPNADLSEWRSAKVEGTWATQFTVLLDNRNLDGRPGYWVATPLINLDGSAVLILRGWLPRLIAPMGSNMVGNPVQSSPQLSILTPTGIEQIVGEMTPHVPRLFELKADPTLQLAPASTFTERALVDQATQSTQAKQIPQATQSTFTAHTTKVIEADIRQLPTLQNLQLEVLANATGLKLLPIVLKQTSAAPDGLIREWAGPSTNSDTNLGYAMQWFAFASIAIIAAGVLGWRGLKRAKI